MKYVNKIIHYINIFVLKYKGVEFGSDFSTRGLLFIRNNGSIKIGSKCKINSGKNSNPIGGDTVFRIVCSDNAEVYIGDSVGISNSTFFIKKKIVIENHAMIGGGCKFWDSDFHSLGAIERTLNGDNDVKSKEIVIGEKAFIGAGSIVLKGVHIGENSIIGAGSVLTKSVPSNEVWAGNPAKKIRDL